MKLELFIHICYIFLNKIGGAEYHPQFPITPQKIHRKKAS